MAYSGGDQLLGGDFQVLLDKTEADMLQITNNFNCKWIINIKDIFKERFQLQMAQYIREWTK